MKCQALRHSLHPDHLRPQGQSGRGEAATPYLWRTGRAAPASGRPLVRRMAVRMEGAVMVKCQALCHSLHPDHLRPQGQSGRGEAATPYHFRESNLLGTAT